MYLLVQAFVLIRFPFSYGSLFGYSSQAVLARVSGPEAINDTLRDGADNIC